ncbi:MAG: hypothetical protein FWD46_02565 [Cystobacterineae bacterium]|nr:hypothetical protein [Cystobacterineae bacterium]
MRYEFFLQKQDGAYGLEETEAQLCAQGALPQTDGHWLWPLAPSMDCWIRRVKEGERCFHALGLSLGGDTEKALKAFEVLLGFAQSQNLELIDAQQLKKVTEKDEASFLAQYARLRDYADGHVEAVFAHTPPSAWPTPRADARKPARFFLTGPMAWVFLGVGLVVVIFFYKLAQKFLTLPL